MELPAGAENMLQRARAMAEGAYAGAVLVFACVGPVFSAAGEFVVERGRVGVARFACEVWDLVPPEQVRLAETGGRSFGEILAERLDVN